MSWHTSWLYIQGPPATMIKEKAKMESRFLMETADSAVGLLNIRVTVNSFIFKH